MNTPTLEEVIAGGIQPCRKLLDELEHSNEEAMTDDLKDLRHRIFFVHAFVESAMEYEIYSKISKAGKVESEARKSLVTLKVMPLMQRLRFREKTQVCLELKIIDEKLVKRLQKLNELRNKFAHAKEFGNPAKTKAYENPGTLKQTYQEITAIMATVLVKFSSENNPVPEPITDNL